MGYLYPFPKEIPRSQDYGANPGWGPNPPGGHNGDDYATVVGTPVRAAGDGTIIWAGQFDDTYADNWGWNLHYGGIMVILNTDGPDGPYFEYGHLSVINVKVGDRVMRGQIIAHTGNTDGGTSVSTGPHCHVGCLEPAFDLGTDTYGRVNPRKYMTDYYQEDELSQKFEEDVRAELAERRQGDLDFQRDVRAELAAHRVMLTADRGITEAQLLDAIRDAVIKVEISH